MKKTVLALLLLFPALLVAQTDSTIYVKQFPGQTVGDKVAAAQKTCPGGLTYGLHLIIENAHIPCLLVIDPSLASRAAGTMPDLCDMCKLIDYRNGLPWPASAPPSDPNPEKLFFPKDYGAKGDGNIVFDGSIVNGTNIITSPSGKFSSAMQGKVIYALYGAPDPSGYYVGTVTSFVSATQITVSFTNATGNSLYNVQVGWGTDDTSALQATINAALPGGHVVVPANQIFIINGSLSIASPVNNTIRISGAAAGGSNFKSLPGLAYGSMLLFTGTAGPANTQCSRDTPSGAIRFNAASGGYPEDVEIDHLVIAHANPALGCIVNATQTVDPPESTDVIFYVHDNLFEGMMATPAAGQITDHIFIEGGVEDIIESNKFYAVGRHAIYLYGEDSDAYWNSFTVAKNSFYNSLSPSHFFVETAETIQAGNFTQNTFEGTFGGAQVNGMNFQAAFQGTITGNWVGDGLTSAGIALHLTGGPAIVSGNYFSTVSKCIEGGSTGNSGAISYHNNSCDMYGYRGIDLAGGSGPNSNLEGNVFNPVAGAQMAIYAGSGKIVASNNLFAPGGPGAGYSYWFDPGATGTVDYYGDYTDQTASGILDQSGGGVAYTYRGTSGSGYKSTAAITGPVPVKHDTANAGQVVSTTTSDTGAGVVVGVCMNSPSAGGACIVSTSGPASLIMGSGTCNIGDFVVVDTTTNGAVKCTAVFSAGTVIGTAKHAQTTVGSAVSTQIGLR